MDSINKMSWKKKQFAFIIEILEDPLFKFLKNANLKEVISKSVIIIPNETNIISLYSYANFFYIYSAIIKIQPPKYIISLRQIVILAFWISW